MDRGDVASNVAIGERSDDAGRQATTTDSPRRHGRMTSCLSGLCAARQSDRIGLGWPPRNVAGRVRRFAGCMAWKRSGVRFPLAPLQNCRSAACKGPGGRRFGAGERSQLATLATLRRPLLQLGAAIRSSLVRSRTTANARGAGSIGRCTSRWAARCARSGLQDASHLMSWDGRNWTPLVARWVPQRRRAV